MTTQAAEWTCLGDWGGFEYWEHAGEVFRRKPCSDNYISPDGQPSALRWEGSLAWFERFVAGRLPV